MGELIYYLDGNFVPAAEAMIPLGDLGVVRGYGVFDFLRTYNGRPFHLMDHLLRLKSSADQIGLKLPLELEEIADVVRQTLAHNDLPEANIRLVVTGGVSSNYFTPDGPGTLAVMVTPTTAYPQSYYTEGTKVVTTEMGRELASVKSLNYIGAIMAMREAAKEGAVEAIYVDQEGQISEGTRSNFFVVKDGVIITSKDDVLFGVTRNVLIEVATQAFDVVERPITLADLAEADEAFLTSSTKEVMPVVQVDEIVIGDGRVGPVSQQLLTLFRAYALGPEV